jgi:plasmid stabilization system protein ParE
VKVLWTDAAVAQLRAIHDYVAQTSPEYARRIIDRLTKRSIQIAAFPFSGRIVPEYELNEVREFGDTGKTVTIAEGETVEKIDFSLVRGGVITGRVTDADGAPVIGQRINLASADKDTAGAWLFALQSLHVRDG